MITSAGGIPGVSYLRPQSGTGKSSLDRKLTGLNAGVQFGKPVLALRDLDHDSPCAPTLVNRLLPTRNPRMLLRVCVRETETWLLADTDAYAAYCGTKAELLPPAPDELDDPKRTILELALAGKARKLAAYLKEGRSRSVPDWALLGEWHSHFAKQFWDPARTTKAGRSPSLCRSFERLVRFIASEGST